MNSKQMNPIEIRNAKAADKVIKNLADGTNNEEGSGLGLQLCKDFAVFVDEVHKAGLVIF